MLKSVKINNNPVVRVSKTMQECNDTQPGTNPFGVEEIRTGTGSRQVLQMTHDAYAIPESHEFSIPAVRCFRCGDMFPVTDFLSTKKSGLCISCWETKISQY